MSSEENADWQDLFLPLVNTDDAQGSVCQRQEVLPIINISEVKLNISLQQELTFHSRTEVWDHSANTGNFVRATKKIYILVFQTAGAWDTYKSP